MLNKRNNSSVHALIMDQIYHVENCLIKFESFIRASSAPETVIETLAALSASVSEAEAAADASLRQMIDSLGKTSFLPSTRQDLISVATSCDAIANKCETFSQMVVHQHFRFPADFNDDLLKVLSITHMQFEVLKASISNLFSNFNSMIKDHSILDEIRDYESEIDVIEQNLYGKTFALDMDLAHQTQISNFVTLACDLSDIIENIADKIQIMLVTRKA